MLFHVGMPLQQLPQHLAQDSHAVAVYNAYAAGGGHHGAVQEFVHVVARFFGALAVGRSCAVPESIG
jgi:hypothetical protein